MKIVALTIGVVASTFVVASTSADSASTYYPLFCKGGNVTHDITFPGGGIGSTATFQRATRAAGREGTQLEPGTCAWFDRPMSAAEPPVVSWGPLSVAGQQHGVTLQFNARTGAVSYTSGLQQALDTRPHAIWVQQVHSGARAYVGDKIAEATDPGAKTNGPKLPEADPLANAFEGNVNRPGGDFWNGTVPYPLDCRNACLRDARCKAWTWVRPANWSAASGGAGACHLKSTIPNQVTDSTCISGVR